MIIRSKAPFRIAFAGGGTDVPPYCDERGGVVFNATIDRYAYVTVTPRDDEQFKVESLDYDVIAKFRNAEDLEYNGELDLVKASIKNLKQRDTLVKRGADIFIHSDVPAGSGLGSSSTVCVALVGALAEYYRIPYTNYEVAQLAYHIEREDLGIKGGLQDQYAATFGGFNFMEFRENLRVVVNPLRLKDDILNELHYHLLLAYTGKSRFSDHILDNQIDRYKTDPGEVVPHYEKLKDMARKMKDAVITGNLHDFGLLLEEAWQNKKQVSEKISNPRIEEVHGVALENGAIGGRILGAGGGGHMLFYVDYKKKHQCARALQELGCEIKSFQFEHSGLQTWIQK
ncbi:MAG: GHMP family kinase ATP-binding protein [Promethearchaeota archaeon]